MMAPQVFVLSGMGINCERETAAALRLAGASVDIVHISSLLLGRSSLQDAQLVVFPGGFSFGDHLGAGQALANRIRYRQMPSSQTLFTELATFVDDGGFLLGICNGFQVLAKLGLVPNTRGKHIQEVSLAENLSGRYENRWCRLATATDGPARSLASPEPIELPVRHGEGRVVFRDRAIRQSVIDQSLNWLTYVSQDGVPATAFPENPNGADLSCAGLCDPTGHVFGLMPHPEAFATPYMHYNWPRRRRDEESFERKADGLQLVRSLLR
ncbi:phosphoribosylformylglycinamidine synthase subunit PurQ, partial [Candidatus Bipolaricaulota bacterium]|nr:phosphoribosylformylglycinamidine synthase subunit PurQ [Candidatus Bipolaricaulota bacterium]